MALAFPFFRAKGPSEKELEAIFYQADTELKGEISREELVEPLVFKSGTDWGRRPFGGSEGCSLPPRIQRQHRRS